MRERQGVWGRRGPARKPVHPEVLRMEEQRRLLGPQPIVPEPKAEQPTLTPPNVDQRINIDINLPRIVW